MALRLRFLTFFLLASCLMARGQDFRTGVPTADGGYLVAGEYLAWLDAEGNVQRKRPLDQSLMSMATAGERLYAIDTDGQELLSLDEDGTVVSRETLPVRGRLTALAADGKTLWAVTDAGEILHDGSGWTVLDFNAQYDGYYPRMEFRAVAAGGGSVMVAGVRPDGTPAAFTSSRGTVWSERLLDYSELGQARVFSAVPMDLSYDPVQDRFYLLGDGGSQLALPGCSHCNSLTRYPAETLLARIPGSAGTLLLGSDGFLRVEKR